MYNRTWNTAYCIQAYSPWLKDIECLEGVQRRTTKMVQDSQNMNYQERLSQLNLTTLHNRRLRGDLIETYKLLTNKDINFHQFFQLAENPHSLRGTAKECTILEAKECTKLEAKEKQDETC